MNFLESRLKRWWMRLYLLAFFASALSPVIAAWSAPIYFSLPTNQKSGRSAGVFVGVNNFEDPTLPPLKYAVNDAIHYAYVFCRGLGLIEATNCFLLTNGLPTSDSAKRQLSELINCGIKCRLATSGNILDDILEAKKISAVSEAMLFVSFATHGGVTTETSHQYAITATSSSKVAGALGFDTTALENDLRTISGLAGKRIVVLDICRTLLRSGGNSSQDQKKAFEKANGLALIQACGIGSASQEDEQEQGGAFSTRFLKGLLTGAVPADPKTGFITLRGAFEYAQGAMKESRFSAQIPQMLSDHEGDSIPLASAKDLKAIDEAISKARENLRRSLDPIAPKASISGHLVDQLWWLLSNGDLPTRQIAAEKINEFLGPREEKGRAEFRDWWTLFRYAKRDDGLSEEQCRRLDDFIASVSRPLVRESDPTARPHPILAQASFRSTDAAGGLLKFRTNSLDMVFRRVPGRSNLWMSIFETRRSDFMSFLTAKRQTRPKAWGGGGDLRLPASHVSWNQAVAFCEWLTSKERALLGGAFYRLPNRKEWLAACDSASGEFAWGGTFPPPGGVGNLAGVERGKTGSIEGYRDGFSDLAPVGSFDPSKNGFYDLVGNVWEWLLDSVDGEHRLLKGAGFQREDVARPAREELHSGFEVIAFPALEDPGYGFRIVLEIP